MIQIHPRDFNKPSARAIEDFINTKYADKVIHKVGLCIGFHSIISTSEGLIGHGSGIINVNVDFRVVVFRPFKGEIIQASITDSAKDAGIELSHEFFEDVEVPENVLFEDTRWTKDPSDKSGTNELYIWYSDPEDTGEPSQFFWDQGEACLYRVEEETWQDLSPQLQKPGQNFIADESLEDGGLKKVPYLIRGSMMLSGLGPMLWWMGDADAPDATEEVSAG